MSVDVGSVAPGLSRGSPQGSGRDSDSSDPEEDPDIKVVEESPCGRWHRRSQTVPYSAVPGIDAAFLAMDIEEGIEVIWNEATFSESKDFQLQKKEMTSALDAMISITHPNIVKFHHYWITNEASPDSSGRIRVIFITEYTASGTLRAFLRKTNDLPPQLKNWSRWCNQLLSALHYMHNLNTVHGNLTTDTIFLQHQGLLKIGCFSIATMRNYVKTNAEENNHIKNSRYFPSDEEQSSRFDIYSFGVIALEMLIPMLIADAEKTKLSPTDLHRRLEEYRTKCDEDDKEKCSFIKLCLNFDPLLRPDAKTLSRHTSLFTLSQLRILAAHAVHEYRDIYPREGKLSLDTMLKNIKKDDEKGDNEHKLVCYTVKGGKQASLFYSELSMSVGDLDKLVLDVQNGLYPITGPMTSTKVKNLVPPVNPDPVGEAENGENEDHGNEDRRAAHIECFITKTNTPDQFKITIDVDLARQIRQDDDSSNQGRTPECKRHLETTLTKDDDPLQIARELANYAFISVNDVEVMMRVIQDQYNLVMPRSEVL